MTTKTILAGLAVVVVGGAGLFVLGGSDKQAGTTDAISSFDECIDAGYASIDTYPERCEMPNGKAFVRVVPEDERTDVTSSITNRGEIVCLPPWDTSASAEDSDCVLGLKNVDRPGDEASHGPLYELRNTAGRVEDMLVGSNVRIEGTLVRGSYSGTHQSAGYIEIERVSPAVVSEEFTPVTFACPADFQFVIWYGGEESERAILDLPGGGERYDLTRARAASGARYVSSDESAVFWEHQGEARVEIDGEVLREQCVPADA